MSLRKLAIMLLAFAGLIAGCSSPPAAPAPAPAPAQQAAPAPKQYKIAFANLAEDIPFTVDVRKGIEKAAKAANVNLVLADNHLDGATALSNAENFITQKADFVIEFQTDEQFGNVIMDKFRSAGIKGVIAIDIPMPGATFFGADNYKAGKLAGQAAGKAAKDKWNGLDKVIMLELPQSGPIPAARMQGQLDGVKEAFPNLDVKKDVIHLDSKNTLEEARRLVTDVLTSIPNAKHIAILCINDDTALGSVAALEAAGRCDQAVVVGQGADQRGREELKNKPNSPFLGSTAYFPEKYGEKIIPNAIKILEGQQVPPSIYADHVFLDRSNLAQYYPNG